MPRPSLGVMVFGALINAALMTDPLMGFPAAALYLAGVAAALLLVWKRQTRAFAFALAPLGFSMWVAHFSYHLFAGWRSIIPVLQRWLHVSGVGQTPAWLPQARILLLDAGLILSIYIAWRTARRSLTTVAPWAVLAVAIYAASVWILFQPMQMRGMVM
jgi:hypothetical protein